MGEEEKIGAQPQASDTQPAPASRPTIEVEKVSDQEFAAILDDQFADFKKLAALLPSFKTAEGDLVRGVEWLDPKKDFQRKEFLNKPEFAKQRALLKQRLEMWVAALATGDNLDEVRKQITDEAVKLEKNLEKNMRKVHRESRAIETTYRAIDKFFANAQQEPDEKIGRASCRERV